MNKRQAKIEALRLAASFLYSDANMGSLEPELSIYAEFGKNAPKIHDALNDLIDELNDRVARLEEANNG